FAASWQLRLVMVGSRMENVEPDWVVFSVTGLGPFQAAVPLPWATCSRVCRTAPVAASTSTVSRLTPSAPRPFTVVSQASRGRRAPRANTTSWVPSTEFTVASCLVATAWAALLDSDGVVDRTPIGRVIATELVIIWPEAFVAMTKSPPTTGRLLYVRRY